MLALRQTIECVSDLLGSLPGTTFLGCNLDDAEIRFEVLATGPAATKVLNQLSLGANVAIFAAVGVREPVGSPTPAVKFVLVASTAERDGVAFGELQLLGIHLVWHLHKVGMLELSRANSLLQGWGGAAVGVQRRRIDRAQPRSDPLVEQARWRPSTLLMERAFLGSGRRDGGG